MKKKLLLVLVLLSLLSPLGAVSIFANDEPEPTPPPTITTFAQVIVTAYKTEFGLTFYRRWNQTKGVWVDQYWTQVGY